MLSINIWDLLWTFVNFFLLYLVLNKLLYTPITRFMDARQARIDEGLDQERLVREALRAGEERLAGEKEQARAQARQLIEEAQAARGEKQEELAKEKRRENQSLRQQLREETARLGEEEAARLKEAEPELAQLLLRRLLREDA